MDYKDSEATFKFCLHMSQKFLQNTLMTIISTPYLDTKELNQMKGWKIRRVWSRSQLPQASSPIDLRQSTQSFVDVWAQSSLSSSLPLLFLSFSSFQASQLFPLTAFNIKEIKLRHMTHVWPINVAWWNKYHVTNISNVNRNKKSVYIKYNNR